MKKKRMRAIPLYGEGYKKMAWWTVQLLCLLLVLNLNLSAKVYSQHQRLSLNLTNATFEQFIAAIKEHCEVGFIYDYNSVKLMKAITIQAQDEEVASVLDRALKGSGFYAEIENNTIIIRKAAVPQTVKEGTTISGVVMDKDRNTLPGVTIVIKGTSIGTTTNLDGKFDMTLPDPVGKTLVFTFVGMESMEVAIKSVAPLTITMKTKVAEMEEVVITGIYSRKKESFTGSSQTYTSKELKMIGNTNVLQSLKTIDPSFAINENNQFGSDPNTLPDINVRGKTSVVGLSQEYDTDPNQPLFILDGFESTLATITNLSMDRVASITVLKDAAATAIYGSKAANGVVVVETKAPEAGKLQVNYNANLNLSFADLSDYNLMNSSEKLEFEKLAGFYDVLDEKGEIINDGWQQIYYNRLAEIRRGVDTYWMSEPLRFATSHSHDLFIEGGDSRMRYGLGINYNKTQGVMKDSDKDVLNGNVRLIYRYNNLAFTNYVNIDYSVADREKVAFSKFSQANPYLRKLNENGEPDKVIDSYQIISTYNIYNPLYDMQLNSSNTSRSFGFRNNFEVDWKIIESLRLRGRVSVSKSVSKSQVFKSPKESAFSGTKESERGSYNETNGDVLSYDADVNATFGKLIAEKHMINAVGGMQVSSSKNKSSGFTSIGYVDDRNMNPTFSTGYPENGKPAYSNSERRSASYYINAGYSYDNRYLLDANYRADGSSVFGVSNKFTTTWAVGIAWNLHNEGFLRNSSAFDFLKLRFSIGNPGNQNFSAYMSSNMYGFSTGYTNPFGLGMTINTWGNSNLEWQKTIDQNYGVDMEFFHRRLRLNFDYFIKNTDPLLVSVTLPTSTGTGSIPTNLGKQTTTGYTIAANVVLMQKEELNWNVNVNARHLKYEYKNIGNALDKYNTQNREEESKRQVSSSSLKRYYDGGSPSDLWAVRSAGIDPTTGREIFIKKDGTQTFTFDYADEVIVGNTDPKLEGVIGTSFYWKGFSASINLRYRLGGQLFLNTLYNKVENISKEQIRYNQDKRALYDRWQKPGDHAKFKAISIDATTPMSSRFIADENTLSGESISLGYETTAKWLQRIGASSMTIRGYMNEIFRISTVKNERGLDYPFARSISFSLGLRF